MDPRFEPAFSNDKLRQPGATPPDAGNAGVVVQDQNKVLRNTYWLLALSLLPTIAGAWVGMQLNLLAWFIAAPIAAPLTMFGVMIAALFIATRFRNSAWGVPAALVFTFIAGISLTPILTIALGLANGAQLIAMAAGGTAAIFFAMATLATVSKRDFSFLGKFLFVGLIVVVLASLASVIFQMPAVALAVSAAAVLLFSLFLLFDINRIVRGGETNYITATLSVYLSLLNLFVSLLNILMAISGQRD
jgi:FtsH-binding integral membrane protein